ncbi:UDP-N-acetylmuramate--L-alanine ligase [Pelagibacteraceae bacterium]|nr:UDP-N-acetylmuramate--L-alanine ligase [Pelagibacteraceae bacterium]
MSEIKLGKREIIHFIGIGGIGMSGLAQIMKTMGFKVQGSDISKNKNIENCKKLGIKILIGQKKKNINKVTIVVKSSAIKSNNIELFEAKKKNIPIYDRIEMLANVISLKKNIIITGSHGKTTTTSLVARIISTARLDPTIINGGVINSLKNNAKLGRGEWAVVEADESDGSFLKVPINYSIVTNIDREHIDYYKNFNNLLEAFQIFIEKTPPIGKSFLFLDDLNIKKIIKKLKVKNYFTYGFHKDSNYQVCNAKYEINYTKFDLKIKNIGAKNSHIKNIFLNLIGKHNVTNATAAISLCLNLGLKENVIKKALKNFSGVQRRLTKVFKKNKIEFYDDYAHHPTEIKSVLEGVKVVARKRKIISVFQPHRYSRIKSLKLEFASCFKNSDQVILCPIYAAGEPIDKTYKEKKFAQLISKFSKTQVILVNNESNLTKYFRKNLIKDEIVIGMGAGSISKWMHNLKNTL